MSILGIRALSYAVGQLISDRSFPTLVSVNFGQLKMCHLLRAQRRNGYLCIGAFVQR